jgi:hypothetical protein
MHDWRKEKVRLNLVWFENARHPAPAGLLARDQGFPYLFRRTFLVSLVARLSRYVSTLRQNDRFEARYLTLLLRGRLLLIARCSIAPAPHSAPDTTP